MFPLGVIFFVVKLMMVEKPFNVHVTLVSLNMLLGNIQGKILCKSWTFSSTMCKLEVQHVIEKIYSK